MTAEPAPGRAEFAARFRAARDLEKSGQWPEAERAYGELLTLLPGHTPARLQLATVLHQQGRPAEAIACLEALLTIDPGHPQAHANLGALRQLQGEHEAAKVCYRQALALKPDLAVAATNLAELLARSGDPQLAEQELRRALAADPNNAALLHSLAALLRELDQSEAAVEVLRTLLRADPHHPGALLDLGGLLMQQGGFPLALRCYERLLRRQSQHPQALFHRGQALGALGELPAAIASHQAALAIDPTNTEAFYEQEHLRLAVCDWDHYDERVEALRQRIEAHLQRPAGPALSPLRLLSFPVPLDLHRRVAERWSQGISRSMAALKLPLPEAAPLPRRLRLGYLSADFRNHAMGTLIHGLFTHHDRNRFAVFAYSLAPLCDPYTESVQDGVETFRAMAGCSGTELAERIRADRIDVLIDLMGYTHRCRPGVLAMRPAPVQLLYLGYPGSMGADFIDGTIADHWLIPPELEHGYRERVHRLPWAFVSSPPPPGLRESTSPRAADEPPPAATPLTRAALGLPEQAVVYACFNRADKLDPHTFDRWLQVLRQVPGSVLWLVQEQPLVQQRLRARAVAAGVAPERLVFSAKVATVDFPALCALADLFLDTAPYGAGATGVAALQAGLPLLTCPGEHFASRMGACLCAAGGMDELICPSAGAYVKRAIGLGRDSERLRELCQRLLDPDANLPLFDTAGCVRHWEDLLHGLLFRQAGKESAMAGADRS
jgi:predicted O-linked N-acetylglucosamine transferase (SPINDLY family)